MKEDQIETIQAGYVYILSNPALPGLLKIGASRHCGDKRAEELYTSGVPQRFNLEFEIMTKNLFSAESRVHFYLNTHRHNNQREFFKIDLKTAILQATNACLYEDIGTSVCVGLDDVFIAREDLLDSYYEDSYFKLASTFIRDEGIEVTERDVIIYALLNKLSEGSIIDAVNRLRAYDFRAKKPLSSNV